jgi:hypothetical protein
MWAVAQQWHARGRLHSLLELALAGILGLAVYVVSAALVGGPRPSAVPALLRGEHG